MQEMQLRITFSALGVLFYYSALFWVVQVVVGKDFLACSISKIMVSAHRYLFYHPLDLSRYRSYPEGPLGNKSNRREKE